MTRRRLMLLLAWMGYVAAFGIVANVALYGEDKSPVQEIKPYLPKELLLVSVDTSRVDS